MRFYRFLLTLTLAWCFCVVVFGAYVRLSDAGLGCPDWPGCYGHLAVPEAEHEVAAAQERFPQRPVEAHKAWKEMIHRYLASTLGLLIIGVAVLTFVQKETRSSSLFASLLVPLVGFQGVLGMWTVTWQLKPLAVTGHLLGGMTTLCGLLWLWLSTRPVARAAESDPQTLERVLDRSDMDDLIERGPGVVLRRPVLGPGLRRFALLALVVVAVQVFLGGWTSTNYAALACPDFPTCQGVWLPKTDVAEAYTLWRGLGINYEYGVLQVPARVTIHFFHRVGALVVTLLLLGLGSALLRRSEPGAKAFGAAVLAALALQVGLGITIVELQLPLLLSAAHNAGAACLLLTLVSLNFFAWRGRLVYRTP